MASSETSSTIEWVLTELLHKPEEMQDHGRAYGDGHKQKGGLGPREATSDTNLLGALYCKTHRCP